MEGVRVDVFRGGGNKKRGKKKRQRDKTKLKRKSIRQHGLKSKNAKGEKGQGKKLKRREWENECRGVRVTGEMGTTRKLLRKEP